MDKLNIKLTPVDIIALVNYAKADVLSQNRR